MIEPPRFVLASGSPRRRELLSSIGWTFDIVVPEVDESPLASETPADTALRLARLKALAVSAAQPGRTCIGADTVVDVDGRNFGKPHDREDARRMLYVLSGREHAVHTGVALAQDGTILADGLETTAVRFAALDDEEIESFVSSGMGDDKAGAYAIQGIGATLVERIDGCYYNVVGLPIRLLYSLVKRLKLENLTTGDESIAAR